MVLTVVKGITKENGLVQIEGLTRDDGLVLVPPFVDVGYQLLWREGAEEAFVYNEPTGDRVLWSE